MRRALALIVSTAILGTCGSAAVTPTPTPAPTASATATPAPWTPAPLALDHDVVYFARDRLLPIAAHLDRAGAGGRRPSGAIAGPCII